MSITISRNATSANILKELKEHLMPQDIHVPTSRGYRKRKSSFFIIIFFSEPQWLNSCLKLQKTIPDYFFYNNNSHNRTFVHVIRIVIFNFIVTHG